MIDKRKLILGGIFLLLFSAVLGSFFNDSGSSGKSHMYANFEIFNNAFQSIRSYYYDTEKIETRQLIYGAIDGMMQSLDDEHSAFLKPAELKSLTEDTSGHFGGLGIMIGIREKRLTIISPIYGTPAWEQHLQAGDIITHIEGKETQGISLREAVRKLRGKVGTKVTITIMRKGSEEPFKVTIVRDDIKIETVKNEFIENGRIGYVKITQFSHETAKSLGKVLNDYVKEKKAKALVIDLRNNPGGLLASAVAVTDLFLSEGLIVYTKGRDKTQNRMLKAREYSTIVPEELPVAVLVNKGSASASEILSGAMQDTGRGQIIGEETFGKGSVQTIQRLQDGSAIKLTIALYYTPAGRQIHKKGLKPDVPVDIPKYDEKEQKAVIELIEKKYLKDFLREHKEYTKEDLQEFRQELKEKGIDLSLYDLERWIYWEKNKIGVPDLVNLKFDKVLRKAVDQIKRGKIPTDKLKIFNEAE